MLNPSGVPIEVLKVQADEYKIKANNDNNNLYENAAYAYFLCSTYFFDEYSKNKDIYNFIYTCITKYEQFKSFFINLLQSLSPKELLNLLDVQINFIKDFLKIKKNYKEYKVISLSTLKKRYSFKKNSISLIY